MRRDTIFDGIGDAFERDIYGSSKGYVRIGVLWADLLEALPQLADGGLSVLDAGGGSGHLAVRLASLGHRVTLAEPSAEMLARAHAAAVEAGVSDRLRFIQAPIQELRRHVGDRFDIVLCHAVLEWVAQPDLVVAALAPFVDQAGALSLLFYNRNAVILKRALAGEVAEAAAEATHPLPHGWGDGAVALAESKVREWLAAAGLVVTSKAGIRIFHDLVPPEARAPDRLPALVDAETALRRTEPFASLAQHIHLVARPVSVADDAATADSPTDV